MKVHIVIVGLANGTEYIIKAFSNYNRASAFAHKLSEIEDLESEDGDIQRIRYVDIETLDLE